MLPINVPVPTQIVWASHDPATTREAGFVLFDVISGKQKATQFHVINRAGSFPFREQPPPSIISWRRSAKAYRKKRRKWRPDNPPPTHR
ncbi:MAG: hypothetical protein WBD95_14000 [Xanthobacteraceae bacterium]